MSIFAIFAFSRAVGCPPPSSVMPGGRDDTSSKGSKGCPHPNFQPKSQATVEVTRDTNPKFKVEEPSPPKISKTCPHPNFKLKSQATVQLTTDTTTKFGIKELALSRTKKQARASRPLETNDSDNFFRGRDMRPQIPFQVSAEMLVEGNYFQGRYIGPTVPSRIPAERLMEHPSEYNVPRSTDVYNPPRGRNMRLTPAQRIAVNGRAAANERQAYLSALNAPTLPMPPSPSSGDDCSSSGSSFDYRLEKQKKADDEEEREQEEEQEEKQEEEQEEKQEEEQEEKQEEGQEEEQEAEDDDTDRILAWIYMVED